MSMSIYYVRTYYILSRRLQYVFHMDYPVPYIILTLFSYKIMYDLIIMVTHDGSEISDDSDAELFPVSYLLKHSRTVQYDVRKIMLQSNRIQHKVGKR